MGSNGNQEEYQLDANLRDQIIRALEDNRYEWRTIDGIVGQINVPAARVQQILETLKHVVVRSSVPDEMGRSLYTTRKHYRETQSIGSRFLAALSDKVA